MVVLSIGGGETLQLKPLVRMPVIRDHDHVKVVPNLVDDGHLSSQDISSGSSGENKKATTLETYSFSTLNAYCLKPHTLQPKTPEPELFSVDATQVRADKTIFMPR